MANRHLRLVVNGIISRPSSMLVGARLLLSGACAGIGMARRKLAGGGARRWPGHRPDLGERINVDTAIELPASALRRVNDVAEMYMCGGGGVAYNRGKKRINVALQ